MRAPYIDREISNSPAATPWTHTRDCHLSTGRDGCSLDAQALIGVPHHPPVIASPRRGMGRLPVGPGASFDLSATAVRRSTIPAPHAWHVTKVALCGGCAAWSAARARMERPVPRESRARPVLTAQPRILPPARAARAKGPMDQCVHTHAPS